ncbi:MAG: hypothetical protein QG597_2155, partial [Actinomycetota bacterium]|nr:hypothetical protein [Actinomycetota bacterium]
PQPILRGVILKVEVYMDNCPGRWARITLERSFTLILCLSLLASSNPLAAGAGSVRSRVASERPETAERIRTVDDHHAPIAADARPQPSAPDEKAAADPLPQGTVLGLVVNAAGNAPLAGVQVVASGARDEDPRHRIYLPLLLKTSGGQAAALLLPAALPLAASVIFTTTTAADGSFLLSVPAGSYTLTLTLPNFGLDRRSAAVRANEVSRVADVRLHALDPVVVPVGAAGGKVTNSLANTSLEFPAGALAATQQTRVTYLPNDALPGYFADGSIPMGFAALEPEGLVFPSGKEALWTVAYTGTLPVGTDTLCYWWDGKTNRWRDPVPGKVVDAGGGKKALQARVTHFSAYGHAMPGVAGQVVGGGEYVSAPPNSGQGPCGTLCAGSETNAGTGALAESYDFQSVNAAVFPVGLAIRYATDNDTSSVTARVPFTITSQTPARAEWRLEFQGKTYAGEGYNALAVWDTRNGLGFRVAPGLYEFNATETFYYDSGAQPAMAVKGAVDVRRGDIWPFGFNWISNYDTLLVDHSALVTIIQADGQYLSYLRQPDGSYKPTAGDTGVLVQNPSRTWTRTSPAGGVETWDSLGRLVRLEDPNGNVQTLGHEPLGTPPVEGKWGLTNRLVTITDSSGNVTTLTYGPDGYVSTVTNAIGRAYAFAHDAAGNLTRITDPLGRAVTYEYDGKHMLTAYTDAVGAATRIEYDAQGRAVRHTDALGGRRMTTYGAGENTITDELGNRTTYTYNNYGAITRVTAPLGATNYTFDAQRRVVAVDRPYQKYTYDNGGNLTSASGVTSESMIYVPGTNRLATYTNTAGYTSHFTYDGQGNLTRVVDPLGNTTTMSYNAAGQVTRVTDPLNHSLQLEYNAQGQLVRGTDPLGHVNTAEYDAAGNPARQTDAEGHATAYAYDEGNRATAVTDALGGVTRYDYDRNSSLTRVTDARGNSTSFTYDPLGRATRVSAPMDRSVSVTYDAVGNVRSATDPNGATLQFAYDAAGRLTSTQYPGGSATYRYGENNDLAGYIDTSAAVTYTYSTGLVGQPD